MNYNNNLQETAYDQDPLLDDLFLTEEPNDADNYLDPVTSYSSPEVTISESAFEPKNDPVEVLLMELQEALRHLDKTLQIIDMNEEIGEYPRESIDMSKKIIENFIQEILFKKSSLQGISGSDEILIPQIPQQIQMQMNNIYHMPQMYPVTHGESLHQDIPSGGGYVRRSNFSFNDHETNPTTSIYTRRDRSLYGRNGPFPQSYGGGSPGRYEGNNDSPDSNERNNDSPARYRNSNSLARYGNSDSPGRSAKPTLGNKAKIFTDAKFHIEEPINFYYPKKLLALDEWEFHEEKIVNQGGNISAKASRTSIRKKPRRVAQPPPSNPHQYINLNHLSPPADNEIINVKVFKEPSPSTARRMLHNKRKAPITIKDTIAQTAPKLPAKLSDFEKLDLIGIGGYSKTYLCRYKENNCYYTLKVLHKWVVYENKQIEHLSNEKEVLALSSHPGIIKLFTSFATENTVYFLSEFVPEENCLCTLEKKRD